MQHKTLRVLASLTIVSQFLFIGAPLIQIASAQETAEIIETTEIPVPDAGPEEEQVISGTGISIDTEQTSETVETASGSAAEEVTPETASVETTETTETTEVTETIKATSAPAEETVATAEEPAPSPVLSTDKADYLVGEIVTIFGNFFQALQNIILKIFGSGPDGNDYTESTQNLTTDSSGDFTTTYQLDNVYRPIYTVTASDEEGTELAQTTFTDAPPKADLDQVRNGSATSPDDPVNWVNGNAGASNAHYVEGYSIPYRLKMTDLPVSTSITVTIGYDIKHSSKHAIDYLTHYNRMDNPLHADVFGHGPETVNPLAGISGVSTNISTSSIPDPASTNSPAPGQPTASFNALPSGERVMTLFGGTITGMAYASQGSLTAAQAETQMSITFTVDNPTAVLAWGGHIGSRNDWSFTAGVPNSAGGISGSPYHMRKISWTLTNFGNEDRSLSAVAIYTPPATITIIKDTVPDSAQDFSFTATGGLTPTSFSLDDDSNVTLLNTRVFSGVGPGTYTVVEGANPAGYSLTNISCDGGTSDPGTRTASFIITGGENITCTFINTLQTGHIIVVKDAVPNDAQDFVFTNNFANDNPSPFSLDDDADGTLSNTKDSEVLAGTYSVSEGAVAGWTQTSATCSDGSPINAVVVSPGETVTCTFVNTKDATLTLVKTVDNGDGGNAVANDFQAKIDGGNVPWGVAQVVSVGTHTASETTLAGYTASAWGGNCAANGSVTLAAGENKTCTITNDDQQAFVIVDKTVVNDNGGNAQPNDFLLTVDSNAVSDGVAYAVNPGTYTAGETLLPGYTAGTWGGDCNSQASVTVALGETKTCTITNNDNAPSLTLIKEVSNDDGGNALATAWTLTATGPTTISGTTPVASGPSFDAGTYTLTESSVAGYAAGSWVCVGGTQNDADTVTLGLGESATCTIINNDIAPTLTLIKNVINNNGGNAGINDFGLTIGATAVTSGQTLTVAANTAIAINEAGLTGYGFVSITGNAKCPAVLGGTVTLDEGENVTCTITNDDIPAKITLIKNVINDNGGNAGVNDFGLTIGGTPVSSGGSKVIDSNTPVAIDEAGLTGYDFVSITGNAKCPASLGGTATLDEGEEITCTVTNDDQSGHLIVHKVTDPADDLNVFNVTINGTPLNGNATRDLNTASDVDYEVNVGTYSVSEAAETGWAQTGNTCVDVAVANGATENCIITNTKLGSISGKKFEDLNGDHIRTDGTTDPNLPGWTIKLDLSGTSTPPQCYSGTAETAAINGEFCKVLTDSFGNYEFINLLPGSYIVSEVLQTGWTQTRPNATYGGTGRQADGTYHLTLTAGQVIDDRQFGNFENPTLTVIKHVVNDNGGNAEASNFNLHVKSGGVDVAGSPVAGSESGTTYTLIPGTFAVSEDAPITGYANVTDDTNNGNCDANGNVTLQSGDDKTCTITNDDIQPKLKLVKTVENNYGGTAVADDFQGSVSGTDVDWNAFVGFDAGQYDANETGPYGYTASDWTGDCTANGSVSLSVGDEKTCYIINSDIQPKLTLVKTVINNNGGTLQVADFPLFVDTTAVTSGATNGFDAGTYTVSETEQYGYAASVWSGDCAADGSVALSVGDDKTCTITNDDIQPKLTLTKTVINDNGGTLGVSDFPLFVDQTSVTSGVQSGFDAGTYTASETQQTGYAASVWGGDCAADGSVTLSAGDVKNCTIINNDIAPILKLVKTVANDNGGTAVPDDWTLRARKLCAAGDPSPNCGFSNLGDSGIFNPILAGTAYTLLEQGPAGYTAGSWSCDGGTLNGNKITLALADEVTCTINNDDIAPKLHLRKTITNDNGGTAVLADFTLTADGTDSNDISGTSPVDSDGTLKADTFALSETNVTGYTAGSWSCVGGTQNGSSITLGINQEATCTINNDDISPKLTIVKDADPNDCQDFTFSMTGQDNFLLDDNEGVQGCTDSDQPQSETFDNLLAGQDYSVTEAIPNSYWIFNGASCVISGTQTPYEFTTTTNGLLISLNLADDVTCTFLNEKQSPTRTQGFWQTHTAFTSQIFTTYFPSGMLIGLFPSKGTITNIQSVGNSQLFGAYYANIAMKSTGKGKNAQRSGIDKARMQLLQQLVTAKLNCAAFGCTGAVNAMIANADAAYAAGTSTTAILGAAGQLDGYNNSGDTLIIGNAGKATPKTSQSIADKAFWDNP